MSQVSTSGGEDYILMVGREYRYQTFGFNTLESKGAISYFIAQCER